MLRQPCASPAAPRQAFVEGGRSRVPGDRALPGAAAPPGALPRVLADSLSGLQLDQIALRLAGAGRGGAVRQGVRRLEVDLRDGSTAALSASAAADGSVDWAAQRSPSGPPIRVDALQGGGGEQPGAGGGGGSGEQPPTAGMVDAVSELLLALL